LASSGGSPIVSDSVVAALVAFIIVFNIVVIIYGLILIVVDRYLQPLTAFLSLR